MLQQTQVDRVLPKYARVAGQVSRRSTALAAAPEREVTETWHPLGYNIRPDTPAVDRARGGRASYGGQLPADEETLLSFKGIGAYTAGAIRSFAFGERAAILDTNVARVLFRVFVGAGDPKSHAMKRHLWALSGDARAAPARLRLQPGADGFRRHGLHGAQAAMPRVPAGADVPVDGPRVTRSRIVVTAAVIEQDGRFLLTRRLEGTHLAGRWEFPGGKCEPGETHHQALARELDEELAVAAVVGGHVLSTTHRYDERTVDLHFYEVELLGTPTPQLGQEMRWTSRQELRTLDFPDADAALIQLLSEGR